MNLDFLSGGLGGGVDPESSSKLKGWVRELMDLDESTHVMVSELRCREEGCPPVETVIALLPAGAVLRRFSIHQPAAAITRQNLATLLALEEVPGEGGPSSQDPGADVHPPTMRARDAFPNAE